MQWRDTLLEVPRQLRLCWKRVGGGVGGGQVADAFPCGAIAWDVAQQPVSLAIAGIAGFLLSGVFANSDVFSHLFL